MVDVGSKSDSLRRAKARARIALPETLHAELKKGDDSKKGPILHTCILAGIQAAKRTSDIIPLCHPLLLSGVEVVAELGSDLPHLDFIATVSTTSRTGVEMEALHAASAAALTFYDMVKSRFRALSIGPIELLEKSGGKSGDFRREEPS